MILGLRFGVDGLDVIVVGLGCCGCRLIMVAAESLPCLIRHVTVGSFHVVNSSPSFEVYVGDYSPTNLTFVPKFVPCHGLD